MSLRRLLATTNSRDHLTRAPQRPSRLQPSYAPHNTTAENSEWPHARTRRTGIHPKRWRKAHFTRFAPQPHARTRRKPPRREHPSLVPLRPPRGGAETERDLRLSSARGSEAEQLWWGRSIYKGAHAAFIQNSRSARRDHFLMTLAVGPNAPPPTSKVSQPDATAVGLNAPLPAPAKVRQPDATAVGLNAPPQPPRSASSATPVRPQRLLLSSGLRLGVGFRLNELDAPMP